jgi:gluconolactonase
VPPPWSEYTHEQDVVRDGFTHQDRGMTMRRCSLAFALILPAALGNAQRLPDSPPSFSNPQDAQYVPGPDSQLQPGVPRGRVFEFTLDASTVFPGTRRKITVYVPAQYHGAAPACVYVGLDGLLFEAPIVFDNLIHKREMPVTIGIGIAPGAVESARAPQEPRYSRSLEFDSLNDDLARFVLEEVLPAVERQKTPEGVPILLSRNPNDRAAGGASTGGIGSFTLAWERPDDFRRVFSAIGTYVGMRGGDRYPVLVRKTEPKPLRIFLQDGSNDGLPGFIDEVGDWWMSNQTMQRALQFAGYQVAHAWGEGSHSMKHPTAVFPDAMRWLWKDWPQPVTAGQSQNSFFRDILVDGESWQPVPAEDRPAQALLRTAREHRIRDASGREYFTDPSTGVVSLKEKSGKTIVLDSELQGPTAIALSPDGLWLAVAESRTHWGYSYRVEPNGTLRFKQRLYWFHVPDEADDSGASSWVFDREGRLYAATRMGIQVFDRNGRVRAIMPVPGKGAVAVAFGGEAMDTLYVLCADGRSYRRKLKVPGVPPGAKPIELPKWIGA